MSPLALYCTYGFGVCVGSEVVLPKNHRLVLYRMVLPTHRLRTALWYAVTDMAEEVRVQRARMSFREQTLAGSHHPLASGDLLTSGDYRWGAHCEA